MTDWRFSTLWSDATRSRFFVIPDIEEPPPGAYPIFTLTGRRKRVDANSLAPYELSEDEAKEWLKMQFADMLDNSRAAITQWVADLKVRPSDPDKDLDKRDGGSTEPSSVRSDEDRKP